MFVIVVIFQSNSSIFWSYSPVNVRHCEVLVKFFGRLVSVKWTSLILFLNRSRFESFGFHAIIVDGHDIGELDKAFQEVKQDRCSSQVVSINLIRAQISCFRTMELDLMLSICDGIVS